MAKTAGTTWNGKTRTWEKDTKPIVTRGAGAALKQLQEWAIDDEWRNSLKGGRKNKDVATWFKTYYDLNVERELNDRVEMLSIMSEESRRKLADLGLQAANLAMTPKEWALDTIRLMDSGIYQHRRDTAKRLIRLAMSSFVDKALEPVYRKILRK